MRFDVVCPVFNNLEVLRVTLPAILDQILPDGVTHEVIVVDDGSDAETKAWLAAQEADGLRIVTQPQNRGRAAARNAGMRAGTGPVVVFLDSDVLVRPDFLACHAETLGLGPDASAYRDKLSIGKTVDIHDLSLPDPVTDKDARRGLPHFTSANVAISRELLERVQETQAGPFDETSFARYGWEDLELERRLARLSPKRLRCAAIGYHHCPPFSEEQLETMLTKEKDRAAMARVFLAKHPDLSVRLITQNTVVHRMVWGILSLGGLLNDRTMRPVLGWMVARGWTGLASSVARITVLNPTYIRHL